MLKNPLRVRDMAVFYLGRIPMTERYAIRSATHSVPFGGVADGLTQLEMTMAESLPDAGYATALFGISAVVNWWTRSTRYRLKRPIKPNLNG